MSESETLYCCGDCGHPTTSPPSHDRQCPRWRYEIGRPIFHQWLDRALDATAQGESFLPEFVRIVLRGGA